MLDCSPRAGRWLCFTHHSAAFAPAAPSPLMWPSRCQAAWRLATARPGLAALDRLLPSSPRCSAPRRERVPQSHNHRTKAPGGTTLRFCGALPTSRSCRRLLPTCAWPHRADASRGPHCRTAIRRKRRRRQCRKQRSHVHSKPFLSRIAARRCAFAAYNSNKPRSPPRRAQSGATHAAARAPMERDYVGRSHLAVRGWKGRGEVCGSCPRRVRAVRRRRDGCARMIEGRPPAGRPQSDSPPGRSHHTNSVDTVD